MHKVTVVRDLRFGEDRIRTQCEAVLSDGFGYELAEDDHNAARAQRLAEPDEVESSSIVQHQLERNHIPFFGMSTQPNGGA